MKSPIVAHGGYGRRDVAPYSDVDLMILHRPAAAARLLPLAERLVRDVFDAGLVLGHSVRTVRQACRLATREPMICTSLVDSRLLAGNPAIFESFMHSFRQRVRWRRGRLLAAHQEVPRRGAASLRRDGLPPGTQHQAIAGHAPRSAVAALDRVRPLRRGRLRRTPRLRRVEPGRLRRRPAGLRLSALAAQRPALSRRARPTTC